MSMSISISISIPCLYMVHSLTSPLREPLCGKVSVDSWWVLPDAEGLKPAGASEEKARRYEVLSYGRVCSLSLRSPHLLSHRPARCRVPCGTAQLVQALPAAAMRSYVPGSICATWLEDRALSCLSISLSLVLVS